MSVFTPRAVSLAMTALLLLLVLAGCGKKGPVQPLYAVPPEAPRNLQVHQQGDSFLLSWQAPARNQDGTPAEDLGSFQIFRSSFDASDGCPTCREPQELVANVALGNPEAVQQVKHRFFWRDRQLAIGSGYAYRVVALTHGKRTGEAALVHQVCQAPPPAPLQLQADLQQNVIVLSWQPTAALPEGSKPAGYNLYRRLTDGPAPLVPVNAKPLKKATLADRSLEPGRRYEYRVSALARIEKALLESPLSEAIQVTLPADQ